MRTQDDGVRCVGILLCCDGYHTAVSREQNWPDLSITIIIYSTRIGWKCLQKLHGCTLILRFALLCMQYNGCAVYWNMLVAGCWLLVGCWLLSSTTYVDCHTLLAWLAQNAHFFLFCSALLLVLRLNGPVNWRATSLLLLVGFFFYCILTRMATTPGADWNYCMWNNVQWWWWCVYLVTVDVAALATRLGRKS